MLSEDDANAISSAYADRDTQIETILQREIDKLLSDELSTVIEEKTGLQSGHEPDDPLAGFLSYLHVALLDVGPQHLAQLDKDDLLISFATALLVMGSWGERHSSDLHVIHYESSVMLHQFEDWVKVTAASVPKTLVGRDRRVMHYPIGVKSTRFECDENWAGLQLADLVAGALFRAGPHMAELAIGEPTSFETQLIDVMGDWSLVDKIWPAPHVRLRSTGSVRLVHSISLMPVLTGPPGSGARARSVNM